MNAYFCDHEKCSSEVKVKITCGGSSRRVCGKHVFWALNDLDACAAYPAKVALIASHTDPNLG